jgi:hypothetical protein
MGSQKGVKNKRTILRELRIAGGRRLVCDQIEDAMPRKYSTDVLLCRIDKLEETVEHQSKRMGEFEDWQEGARVTLADTWCKVLWRMFRLKACKMLAEKRNGWPSTRKLRGTSLAGERVVRVRNGLEG